MNTERSNIIQHFNCYSMGTRFDFLTYGLDEGFFLSAKTFILNELERIEQKFSRNDEKSEIYKINTLAATEIVKTDFETVSLLELCKDYYDKTNKLFDITVGKFTHTTLKTNPTEENQNRSTPISEVDNLEFSSSIGADKIKIDMQDYTVRFLNPTLSIDLGGIGKGYAMEKIKDYCKANSITNALISFGNSSITTLGKHPHGDFWPIGIQHAFSNGSPIYTLKLNDGSMSTSGNTSNNRIKFGNTGHIINPHTGEFQNDLKTITVISDSSIDAEVLSTSLFIAGDLDRAEIISIFCPLEAIAISYNQINESKIINLIH